MNTMSFAAVALWVVVAIVAAFGLKAGLAATDRTLTTRTRLARGAGCGLAFLLVAFFFAGGGMLLLAVVGIS